MLTIVGRMSHDVLVIGWRQLADKFAAVLIPHARQACSDWWSGQLEEEARLEEVRSQLEEEIRRVRKRRADHEKRLELDVNP